jgi:hypothetical protein
VIITSREFVGFFVRGGGGAKQNERTHAPIHHPEHYRYLQELVFRKICYERLLFFKQIPELRPKLKIFLPAKLLINF